MLCVHSLLALPQPRGARGGLCQGFGHLLAAEAAMVPWAYVGQNTPVGAVKDTSPGCGSINS